MNPRYADLVEALPAGAKPGRGVLRAPHRLGALDLFSDDGLVALFDRHPPHDLHLHTMGDSPEVQEWRRGERGDLSGADLLRAVKQGRLWVIGLRVFRHDPEYRALVEALYGDLSRHAPDFRPFNLSANLLVSSPGAQVYYHADAAPTVLWHVRGRKRLFLYPAEDERFISRADLEAIFAGRRGEEIPFRSEYDRGAAIYDLEPGEFLAWPQSAPHRIENLDGLNVSLSTEYYTPDTNLRQAVYNANLYFRERWGLPCRATRIEGAGAWAKANAYRVLRRVAPPRTAAVSVTAPVSFRADPNAPRGFVDLAGPAVGRD